MLILNYTHPITPAQVAQIGDMTGGEEPTIRMIAVQIDHAQPLTEQVVALTDAAGLSTEEWQTIPLLVNLPGYGPAVAGLLAEMHGRIGHFPSIIRLRPIAGSTPTIYEVAELLNLQEVREQAREQR